jgi:hypothetical protein
LDGRFYSLLTANRKYKYSGIRPFFPQPPEYAQTILSEHRDVQDDDARSLFNHFIRFDGVCLRLTKPTGGTHLLGAIIDSNSRINDLPSVYKGKESA